MRSTKGRNIIGRDISLVGTNNNSSVDALSDQSFDNNNSSVDVSSDYSPDNNNSLPL